MRAGSVLGGRYRLEEPLGRGGMGEVWRAYDGLMDRTVAVKFLSVPAAARSRDQARAPWSGEGRAADRAHGPAADTDLCGRFELEARRTAGMDHPGVPAVYDMGEHRSDEHGHRLYLVMQYVDGIRLDEAIDHMGRLSVPWAASIAAQVCGVLAVAHRRPLIHRDLKPGNVMICRDGSVKVLDFGVAWAPSPGDTRAAVAALGSAGTPHYTAPEQRDGVACPQSDLYSLGCIVHEMLTGRHVFTGRSPDELYRAHEEQEPAPLREWRSDVPEGLERLVLRLLAKAVRDRPADAAEVHAELLPHITELGPLADVVPGPMAMGPERLYSEAAARGRFGGADTGSDPDHEPPGLRVA